MTDRQFSLPPGLTTPLLLIASLALSACATFSDDLRDRTPGAVLDDQILETTVKHAIKDSDEGFDGTHVSVISYNGVVLLVGQVPTEALKSKAQTVTERQRTVRNVHNELQISAPISFLARTNDSWITSKIKTKLAASGEVDANVVKVVTEDGAVYLMGMVARGHAEAAVVVASTAYGVQKIVKVFEYLD